MTKGKLNMRTPSLLPVLLLAGCVQRAGPVASESYPVRTAPAEAKSAVPRPRPAAGSFVVSGFEPFGGRAANASWITARSWAASDRRFQAVRIPVLWDAPAGVVRALPGRPPLWIAFGEGSKTFRIETVARNRRADHPDNHGKHPPAAVIEPDGPPEVRNPADFRSLAAALTERGFPTTLSEDAGAYLCEEMEYTLLRESSRPGSSLKKAVFIHVPVLGSVLPPGPDGRARTVDEACLGAFARALREELTKSGWLPERARNQLPP